RCSQAAAMCSVIAVEEPDLLVLHALLVVEGEEASTCARGELLHGGVEAAGEVDAQGLRLVVLHERRAGVLDQLPLAGGEGRRGAGVEAFVVAVRLEDDVAPAARDARHAVDPASDIVSCVIPFRCWKTNASSLPLHEPQPAGFSWASHFDCQVTNLPRLLISTRSFGVAPVQGAVFVVLVICVNALPLRSEGMISPLSSLPRAVMPSESRHAAPAGSTPEKSRVDWKAMKRPSLLIRARMLALVPSPVVLVICVSALRDRSYSMISELPSLLSQGETPSLNVHPRMPA